VSDPATGQPIVVKAPSQIATETFLRQLLLLIAGGATVLGYGHLAGIANGLLAVAGPAAGVFVVIWGQLHTLKVAYEAVAMAHAVNNSVAVCVCQLKGTKQ
jgi:hypothetical protein